MHPNNIVRDNLKRLLGNHPKICLTEPLDYKEFLYVLNKCYLVVTDSGGLQEEAPFLEKPVLVFRDTTEREESLKIGCSKLIGTSSEKLEEELYNLIKNENTYLSMTKNKDIYGDGFASKRILKACFKSLYKDK